MRHSLTPVGRRPTAAAVHSGRLAAQLALGDGFITRGIADAQSTGALCYTMQDAAPQMSLTATDRTGAPVWSVKTGDVWAASGTLPAALVASFTNPDPNVLRDGDLTAYNAAGKVALHKGFKREFVQPLACTPKRLVWLETTAKAVSRVCVRQGGKMRSVRLPYVPLKAHFLTPAAASASGRCVLVGEYMPVTADKSLHMTYWVRVDRFGKPHLVSHRTTEWVGAGLTPRGDKAAIMTSQSVGGVGNLWMTFGRFVEPQFGGEDASEVYASNTRILEQGGYAYSNETLGWGTWSVNVFDRSLWATYQRAWTFDDDSSSVWFSHDRDVRILAARTNAGVVTVINVDSLDTQVLPGTWAAVTPASDGRLATMTEAGVFAYMANPVAGP